jgi:hypothetical protein
MGQWKYSSTFLDLDIRWRWVVGQFHIQATLLLGREPPGTHWIGGRVGLRSGLDLVE